MLGCGVGDVNLRIAEVAAWERRHLARMLS